MRVRLLIVYNEITIKSSKMALFWRNEAKFINASNDRPLRKPEQNARGPQPRKGREGRRKP